MHYVVDGGAAALPPGQPLRRHRDCRSVPLRLDRLVGLGEIAIEGYGDRNVLLQTVYETAAGDVGQTRISRHHVTGPTQPALQQTFDEEQNAGRSRLLGGGFGRDPFRALLPKPASWSASKWDSPGSATSTRCSPFARCSASGNRGVGQQHGTNLARVTRLLARPGYAVGAMTVKAGANADGLSLTFMCVKGDRFDPGRRYQSPWIGDERPGGRTELGGNGKLVLGIIGTKNEKTPPGSVCCSTGPPNTRTTPLPGRPGWRRLWSGPVPGRRW